MRRRLCQGLADSSRIALTDIVEEGGNSCVLCNLQVVVDKGVADPARIAVGGHSYGAFMAANLLAHAGHLFAAGIARSGAYNRCPRDVA